MKLELMVMVAAMALAVDAGVIPQPNGMKLTGGEYAIAAETMPKVVYREDRSLPVEGYRLKVTKDGVEIAYSSPAGRQYAETTFDQLGERVGETWNSYNAKLDRRNTAKPVESEYPRKWPCCEIEDAPAYGWRGLMVDCGRHFFSVDTLKHVLDTMAYHKLNVFHWHLTDDQGWRIEIKSHPELVKWGAVRPESPVWGENGGWEGVARDGKPYGPFFYTQAEIRELIAYAKERSITIVPEIEIPGHSRAVIAAFPDFACEGFALKERAPWCRYGICEDVVCLGNDAVIKLYEDVLDEVCELFDSKVIHIGGDEAPTKHWEACPRCAKRVKTEGLANAGEALQAWCTRHFTVYLEKKGRRTLGWDEYLLGEVPVAAIGMVWRANGGDGGNQKLLTPQECAERGHDLVMTPKTCCYLDYQQGLSEDPFHYIGGYLPLEQVYRFDPVAGIPEGLRSHVLGGQGNNWSEYTHHRYDLDWKMWPRAAALAERLWTTAAKCDYTDFKRRLTLHRSRLIQRGVNCAYFW